MLRRHVLLPFALSRRRRRRIEGPITLSRRRPLHCGWILLAPAVVHGEPEEEPAATIVIQADALDEAEERAPTSFVTVIDTSRYENQFETATTVLSQAVGVQVRRFGGLGAFSTLSIRGSNANQVRFFLDGVPLTTARRDVVNLANLPLDSLERIEIYRGAVPIGFGAEGIAGVVNMVTRPPTEEPRSEIATYYGSFDTLKAVGSHSQRLAGFDVLGHLTVLRGDGDFAFDDDGGTPFDPDDDSRERRLNNRFESVEGLVKVRRVLDEGFEIDLTSDTYFGEQGVPARRGNLSLESSLSEMRTLNYLRGRGIGLDEGRLDATATVFGLYEESRFSDLQRRLFGIGISVEDSSTTVGANILASYYLGDWNRLSAFAEFEFQRFSSTTRLPAPVDLPAQERLDANIAIQDEIGLFEEFIVVVPTLRYEHLTDTATSQFSPAGQPIGGRESRDRDLVSPSIGAEARPWPWLSLKGNIGRYQRAPSFGELFGTRGFVRGNPSLDSETSLNRDIGFVARAPAWRWLGEARLEYAYYLARLCLRPIPLPLPPTSPSRSPSFGLRIEGRPAHHGRPSIRRAARGYSGNSGGSRPARDTRKLTHAHRILKIKYPSAGGVPRRLRP
jgi:iron complex outermembrane recepter protein